MIRSNSKLAIKSSACVMSCCCPPVKRNLNGLPKASTLAWIFVLNPPRLRPRAWIAWPPLFLMPLQRMDVPGQWCYPAGHSPYQDRQQNIDAYPQILYDHSSVQIVCKHCSNSHIFRAASAIVPHFAVPNALLPRKVGNLPHFQHTLAGAPSKMCISFPIGRLVVLYWSCFYFATNVNRT